MDGQFESHSRSIVDIAMFAIIFLALIVGAAGVIAGSFLLCGASAVLGGLGLGYYVLQQALAE